MENPVIIFGANGLGVCALDIFQENNITVYAFLDDAENLHDTEINFTPVLGRTDDVKFLKLIGKKCEAFVATDDNSLRKGITEMLLTKRKVMPVNAVHPHAYLATSASIGSGNLVQAGVIINSQVTIANHCIFNTQATIDYGAEIQDFVQIGTGAVINAHVVIEEGAFIGSGVLIVSGVKIGKNARVGAGSVVLQDVPEGKTVFGNPAKEV